MQQQDYNQTLNLPQTEFPMRAGLPQREPVMLEQWEEAGIYEFCVKKIYFYGKKGYDIKSLVYFGGSV